MDRSSLRDRWIQKTLQVVRFLDNIGTPSNLILAKYNDARFEDGKNKRLVFESVLSSHPDPEILNYLNRRCSVGLEVFRDSRTGAEYAVDLIVSWIQEDAMQYLLRGCGLAVELDGADQVREFLPSGAISASSDFIITGRRSTRKLELAYDSTGYWRKSGCMDLRHSKFDSLVRENALLMGVAIPTSEAFILDVGNLAGVEVVEVPYHPVFRKPAKAIHGIDAILVSLSETVSRIKAVVD